MIPGNTFIIECDVAFLTNVKSGNVLLNVVIPFPKIKPLTFNELKIVVVLFNVVFPDTFNDDINVDGLLRFGIVGGFNIEL